MAPNRKPAAAQRPQEEEDGPKDEPLQPELVWEYNSNSTLGSERRAGRSFGKHVACAWMETLRRQHQPLVHLHGHIREAETR